MSLDIGKNKIKKSQNLFTKFNKVTFEVIITSLKNLCINNVIFHNSFDKIIT